MTCPDRRNPRTCEHANYPRLCHTVRNLLGLMQASTKNIIAAQNRIPATLTDEKRCIIGETRTLQKCFEQIAAALDSHAKEPQE